MLCAFLKAKKEPVNESRYITNPDMIGAAACIQGYPAREGFGITLSKNQIVDNNPVIINITLNGTFCKRDCRHAKILSVRER
jgi:hypothetical protein